ncbi:MAG: single-stranded-DNA-specific exonuclease RecJ [Oscillospiraceae bacterium]
MAFKRWKISQYDKRSAQELSQKLGVPPLLCGVLAARGIVDAEQAREFLEARYELEDPFCIKDMDKAVSRITEAVGSEERIAIFGDYDVDGLTATAMIYRYLESIGADVICMLPMREATGYGISAGAIDKINKEGASLIITVDNGISARSEVEYAKSLGIDIVICDHHLPPEVLPDAAAVVDPLRKDDTSTFKELAGVGVALKLAAAVEGCTAEEMLELYGMYAAVGTVSDIMPLKGENRRIVKEGLLQFSQCEIPGFSALCEKAGINLEKIDAGDVAFSLAPRLNAAGRMGNADLALCLLISDDEEETAELAQRLDALNKERQCAEQEMSEQISALIDRNPELTKKQVIVVAAQNLHSGVSGIACSRLVEKYGKPTIIISIDKNSAKGSGRSIAGFSLYDAISSCAEILQKFGGHEMAAGFTLETGRIEEFRAEIDKYCASLKEAVPVPALAVDCEISPEELTDEAVAGLEKLKPFGSKNREPVFCMRNAIFQSAAQVGEKHCKVTVVCQNRTLSGVMFGVTPEKILFKNGDKVDAAFCASIYSPNGRDIISINMRDMRLSSTDENAYDSIDAFRAFSGGLELEPRQRELLCIAREDVAAVYRQILKKPAVRDDLACVAYEFNEQSNTGRVLAVFEVLEQLGLAKTESVGGVRRISGQKSDQKRELLDSNTYKILSKANEND